MLRRLPHKWALSRCFMLDFGGNRKEGCRNVGTGEKVCSACGWKGLWSSSSEQRTLRQTERVTLPPIHWVVLVGRKTMLKIPPDQTKDGAVQRRCHSVQMHTNEDSRRYLLSSLHTSSEQLTIVFVICSYAKACWANSKHMLAVWGVCHLYFVVLNCWWCCCESLCSYMSVFHCNVFSVVLTFVWQLPQT